MKNILQQDERDRLLQRIDALELSDTPLWGKMNVKEMVCHLADQLRVTLGEIKVEDQSSFMSRSVMAPLVLFGLPIPKGKIETFPEIDLAKGAGTNPKEFDDDIACLKDMVSKFVTTDSSYCFQPHSFFGSFDQKQWARMTYIHFDFHLKQFGR